MAAALLRLLLTRLVNSVPLIIIVVSVTFFLIRMVPGDPAYILAGDAPTPEFLKRVRASYDLNGSIWDQYVAFVSKAVTGDLGTSIYYKKPVFDIIMDRFPATILLTLVAMLVATTVGISLAAAAARRPGSRGDALVTSISLVGYSVPGFWIGQMLILLFAVQLRWLPVGGMESARHSHDGLYHLIDVARHMILPVATLSIFLLSMIARFTRTALVDALGKDFISVARAKGASERKVLWDHAFRAAATSTVTIVGLEFGAVIVGAVLVETIFSWPGLGRLFYDAIAKRDFPLLTGSFIFTAVMVILVNALTDLACAILDPRLRR